MGNPTIFNGQFTKLLSKRGMILQSGNLIENDGTKNYFTNSSFGGGSISPWTTFSATLVNGMPTTYTTGGTAGITAAINSTSTLGSTGFDMMLTKPASNVMGSGVISGVITLNRDDKNSWMVGALSYLIGTGTFDSTGTATQSLQLAILDVTATAAASGTPQWIQPSNALGINGTGKLSFGFQSSAIAGNQYQIVIYTAQTVTTAFTFEVASFSLSAQVQLPTSSAIPITVTRLLSGSGTYLPPAGVKYIEIEMVGGGGGGAGSGTGGSSGTAGNGGNTTFGTFLTAGGGVGATAYVCAAGGSPTATAPAIVITQAIGSGGSGGIYQQANVPGAPGGASPFGGNGQGSSAGANVGITGGANTGSGGSGGSTSGTVASSGAGGGSGGYIKALIQSPLSSGYAYTVGAGGSIGAAGTSGVVGATGGSGVIIIKEFYVSTSSDSGSVIRTAISTSSNQSIPQTTYTKVAFNTVIVDKMGGADIVNYRIYPRVNGSFTISPILQLNASGSTTLTINLYKNGSSIKGTNTTTVSGGYTTYSPSWDDDAISTDYYEMWVYSSSGSVSVSGELDLRKIPGTASITIPQRLAPTIQRFLSGSGTYLPNANNPLYIKVRMVGGGGGGAGGGNTNGSAGVNGTSSTFGTSFLVAGGANPGGTNGAYGGQGGSGSISTATGFGGLGNYGGTAFTISTSLQNYGGDGGKGFFGSGGGGAPPGNAPQAVQANSGGGGAGGSSNPGYGGSGGGAGGWLEVIISPITSTGYAYTVGTGGAGGAAGTSGQAGGAGAAGQIEVTEYYQ